MDLPVEIWYKIVRVATEIPDALDTRYQSPLDHPWPLTEYRPTAPFKHIHAPFMKTKRHLVLVSHTLNAIATRFMYETVIIRGDKDVVLLARTLRDRPEFSGFITRLEFPSVNMSNNGEIKRDLRSILSAVHNLVVLSAKNPTWTLGIDWPSDLRSEVWWPRLRSLEWGTMTMLSPETPWVFKQAPNLEILAIQHSGFGLATPLIPVTLLRLHTLIFHESSYPIPLKFITPDLQQIWTQSFTPQILYPSLKAMTLTPSSSEWDQTGNSNPQCDELFLRWRTFPFTEGEVAFRHIGISFQTFAMLRRQLESLVPAFDSERMAFTQLITIRLIPMPAHGAPPAVVLADVPKVRRQWVFFVYWTRLWRERQVVLEDENGTPFSERFDPSTQPAVDAKEYADWWEPRSAAPAMGFIGWL